MKKAKAKPGNVTPKGTTRFKGDAKIDKLNKQALKFIRAIKGSFG